MTISWKTSMYTIIEEIIKEKVWKIPINSPRY